MTHLTTRWVTAQILLVLALLGHAVCDAQPASRTVRDFDTRAGVTVRSLIVTGPSPKGVIVLLPGGDGGLSMLKNGSILHEDDNFLVRSQVQFANAGYITVLLDASSDHQRPPFLFGFALTPQYAEDIALVIETLQRETPLPIWLVGTSSGAGRLAFVTPQIQDRVKIAGVVLTSTPWSSSKRVPISGWGLGKITVPTLVVHHRNDQCEDCKPDAAATFMSLIGAQSKSIEWIDGGNAMGNPCWAMGHHGFNGVEQQAVDVVVHWMSDKR